MNQPYRPHSGDRQNNRQGNRHSGRPSNSGKLFFRSSTNQDNENPRGPRNLRGNFVPKLTKNTRTQALKYLNRIAYVLFLWVA